MNAIVIEGRKCQVPGGPFVTVELLQDCARQGGTETSQSTDDLTRSGAAGAIRGHYSRRVYIAFLIPALIAVALGWLLSQDQDTNSGIHSSPGSGRSGSSRSMRCGRKPAPRAR